MARKQPGHGRKTWPVEDLAGRIRSVIAARGLTAYAVARAAGLDRTSVRRFLDGADLTLGTASRICAVLGLQLTERPRSTPKLAARPRPRLALDLIGPDPDDTEDSPDGHGIGPRPA